MRGVLATIALTSTLAVSILGGVSPTSAQFRITADRGGEIVPYLDKFAMIRDSGSRVVIDGDCLSACTLVLGAVPKERICVTSRASLGFHAAWNPSPDGRELYSRDGTELLWENYPDEVRRWIRRHGGLNRHMIYLEGRELAAMYQACPPRARRNTTTADNNRRRGTSVTATDPALYASKRRPM